MLSALEGLNVATTAAEPFIVPSTCLVLFGLFLLQRRGTHGIGRIFGPVMLVWFGAIGLFGLLEITNNPAVLWAINPNTITARSVRRLRGKMHLCLSGTPIENNLFELWSLFEFLMPGFLGSQNAFQRGIVKPIKDGDEETLDYLRGRVKPFILRRTKNEVAKDLPPKVENVHYCALIEEQAELYAALAKKLRDRSRRSSCRFLSFRRDAPSAARPKRPSPAPRSSPEPGWGISPTPFSR